MWRVCGIFVDKPLTSFFSVFGVIIAVVVLVTATGNGGNSEPVEHEWDVNEDIHVQQVDLLNNLQERTDIIPVSYTTRQVPLLSLNLIVAYETVDGKDIFTPANVQRMCKIEQKWFGNADYSNFCAFSSGTT